MTAGKMEIPSWLASKLSSEGMQKIANASQNLQLMTRAEVVPMIVRRSSPKGHVRQSVFLLLMVFGLLFLNLEYFEILDGIPGGILSQIGLVAVLSFLFAIPLAKLDFMISKFVSINDQRRSVYMRAEHEFYTQHFDKTAEHSAVLIFISLMERRVVVLADSGIVNKLDPKRTHLIWKEMSLMIIAGLKKDDFALGLTLAMEKAGQLLKEHFPADALQNNQHEISHELRILE